VRAGSFPLPQSLPYLPHWLCAIIQLVKILLVGINAKYIQSNLAIRLLAAYAERAAPEVADGRVCVELGEWNVNEPAGQIVRGIMEREPDAVLFSVYVWNREMTFRVMSDVRKILPGAFIGAGGPEVSWTAERDLREHPELDLIFCGEGELAFVELVRRLADGEPLAGIPGVFARDGEGLVDGGPARVLERLDEIPFVYNNPKIPTDEATRIVYYEASRGCPFSCAYCLSARETSVRYLSLDRVLADISWFLERRFPLVKFVDRTFNLDPSRYLAIWRYIRDNHNGITTFHFEISAESLSREAFELLETMPKGAVQFEIGIQSVNADTLRAVGRPANLDRLSGAIHAIPASIHRHVDLIAGLPREDLASFARSFDYAWALGADMLQLGFLKILPGAPMEEIARELSGYRWSEAPPYEVLQSPALPYRDLCVLKDVEHLVDGWFNSGLACHALARLAAGPDSSAFSLFMELASFVREWFPDGDLYLPRRPAFVFECLAGFIAGRRDGDRAALEYLKYDYFLQGKPGAMPGWLPRRYSREAHDAALVREGFLSPGEGAYAPSRRSVYSRTEFEEFTFDPDKGPRGILFIYPGPGDKEKLPRCIIL